MPRTCKFPERQRFLLICKINMLDFSPSVGWPNSDQLLLGHCHLGYYRDHIWTLSLQKYQEKPGKKRKTTDGRPRNCWTGRHINEIPKEEVTNKIPEQPKRLRLTCLRSRWTPNPVEPTLLVWRGRDKKRVVQSKHDYKNMDPGMTWHYLSLFTDI